MSDWGTKKAFWWVTDWIYPSFGDEMKMKVRGMIFERWHIAKYEKQGMCKVDTDFFFDYTWSPSFSLFFQRIWIDLYNEACLACWKGIKFAKISWWKLVILYELYKGLELVDRYLRERSRFWQNIRFHDLKFSEWLNLTWEVQKQVFQQDLKVNILKKCHFQV